MKILGTGLSGMVGSRITELLGKKYKFFNLDISSGVDIQNKRQVFEYLTNINAPIVLHLAAKTNVDDCEKDKEKDKEFFQGKTRINDFENISDIGSAWSVNAIGTQNIVDACNQTGKKIIYISTDFVFDGEKEEYQEEDRQNPLNWYGYTKYIGEKAIQQEAKDWIIARIAYPYRASFHKPSLVEVFVSRLKNKQPIHAVTDHIMTPTYVDDIAKILDVFIEKKLSGIYHVVGSEYISPYDLVMKIARVFGFSTEMVTATTREEYFKNRAPRGFRFALKNDRIEKLGLHMSSLDEGLKEVKKLLVL